MYADDLLLLSASVVDLQIMLDKCGDCGLELGIKFNSKKSKCIFIGPNQNIGTPATMFINDSPMKWDSQFKYLGIIISSGKSFEIILDDIRRNFFVSVNSILSKCKYTSDLVKLNLLESHCMPILLYAMESLDINNYQLKLINSWWNSVYRQIFSFQIC